MTACLLLVSLRAGVIFFRAVHTMPLFITARWKLGNSPCIVKYAFNWFCPFRIVFYIYTVDIPKEI
jgi:hypothetical protein